MDEVEGVVSPLLKSQIELEDEFCDDDLLYSIQIYLIIFFPAVKVLMNSEP